MRKAQVYVQIQGVKESEQAFVIIDRTYRRLMQAHVDETADAVRLNAILAVPQDTNETLFGIRVARMARFNRKPIIGKKVISDARQTFCVEYGSWLKAPKRPSAGGRKKPPDFRPGSPLSDWSLRHGVNPAALAMAFWKKGKEVAPRPFLGPAGEKERAQWNAGIRRIIFEEVPAIAARRAARLAARSSRGR